MNTKRLVRAAMVAAIYVVLCLVLAPFSYGAVQVRLAEMLCLLPVFGAEYIVAVTLGCFLANLLGSTLVDVVFGTAATLVACLVTYAVRKMRVGGLAIPSAISSHCEQCGDRGRAGAHLLSARRHRHRCAGGLECPDRGHRRGNQLRHSGRGPGEADGEQCRPAPPVLRMSRFF